METTWGVADVRSFNALLDRIEKAEADETKKRLEEAKRRR